jgi:hypothetical protein
MLPLLFTLRSVVEHSVYNISLSPKNTIVISVKVDVKIKMDIVHRNDEHSAVGIALSPAGSP